MLGDVKGYLVVIGSVMLITVVLAVFVISQSRALHLFHSTIASSDMTESSISNATSLASHFRQGVVVGDYPSKALQATSVAVGGRPLEVVHQQDAKKGVVTLHSNNSNANSLASHFGSDVVLVDHPSKEVTNATIVVGGRPLEVVRQHNTKKGHVTFGPRAKFTSYSLWRKSVNRIRTSDAICSKSSGQSARMTKYCSTAKKNFDPPVFDVIFVAQMCRSCAAVKYMKLYESFFRLVVGLFWAEAASADNLKLEFKTDAVFGIQMWQFLCGPQKATSDICFHNIKAKCRNSNYYRNNYQLWCVVPLLKSLGDAYPDVQGIVITHMDFWIHPVTLFGGSQAWRLAHEKLWILGNFGSIIIHDHVSFTYPHCFTASEYERYKTNFVPGETGWHFKDFRKAYSNLSQVNAKARVCGGWADLFYIPRNAWVDFITVAGHLDVFHEAAIPTIMQYLTDFLGHDLRVITECWGGPVDVAFKGRRDDIFLFPCGHAVNLHNYDVARAFENMIEWQRRCFALHAQGLH